MARGADDPAWPRSATKINSDLGHEDFELLAIPQIVAFGRVPFEGVLIAQVQAENLPLISNEPLFDTYGVRRIW